ncbi:hypothetical protein [Azospirillum brasilense]|uniref:hypothetical protein n=1 Tax=Azospirillum brasilense TaxID=192 RepID=UPI000E0BA22D|nr:hypothetical protein [Azospirillum brasilense]
MAHFSTEDLRNRLYTDAETFLWQNVVHYPLFGGYGDETQLEGFQNRIVANVDQLDRLGRYQGVAMRNTVRVRAGGLWTAVDFVTRKKTWKEVGSVYDVLPELKRKPDKTIRGEACAYFLTWIESGVTEIDVRPDAGLFLNATMSGCTMGWLSDTHGGMRVVHSNLIKREGVNQPDVLSQIRERLPDCRILAPETYRRDSSEAYCSVVGVLRNGRWELYYQAYTKDNVDDADFKGIDTMYSILSVRRIA